MPVDFRGKPYFTVAERIEQFREEHKLELSIATELVHADETHVIVRAVISGSDGRILATGLAEEIRDSSQVNRTSAIENCETSAVGRALAFLGYAGTEIASADELAGALKRQATLPSETVKQVQAVIESLPPKTLTWIADRWARGLPPTKEQAFALIDRAQEEAA